MSPKKSKSSSKEKKITEEENEEFLHSELTRRPLYPHLNVEKENMAFASSDDWPEKCPQNHSPRMTRKSNPPSSINSRQNVPNSPKDRSGRYQDNQMLSHQDSDGSDMETEHSFDNSNVEMEKENFLDSTNLQNRRKKKPDISPNNNLPKKDKSFSPKVDRSENLKRDYRKSYQPESSQFQRTTKSDTSKSSFSFPANYILLALFCLVLICFISYMDFIRFPVAPFSNDQLNASTLVNNLKSEFKGQPPLTFRIIYSALKKVLEEEPEAPAILLLLSTNGSETVCSKLAHRLVDLLAVPKYTVKINGGEYRQNSNPNQAKLKIDNIIENTLKYDRLGSVLIKDLDGIPGTAAMILHKYHDHEHAPFKKAVFVMTVNYNKDISDLSDTTVWDKAAYDHLLSAWADVGIDQITPLLTRLTVSVAVITAQS